MYKKVREFLSLWMIGIIIATSAIGQVIPITTVYANEIITEELRAEIEASLYDFEYYTMANEDVAVALNYDEEKMYEHWLNFGIAEGRNASMVFNAKYYLEVNPEVKVLVDNDYIKAYEHFVTTGLLAGLESSPVFSVKYYLEANQDVAEVFGNDYVKAANHFNQNALAEGRSGSGNFDYTVYKDCNTDVADLYGDEIKGYYIHYINHGRAEGRTAGLGTNSGSGSTGGTIGIDENAVSYRIFDAEFYLGKYPELSQNVGTEKNALYKYWMNTGISLGQSASSIFDPAEYLSINTDVAEVVGEDYEAATNHFLNYGIYEGRSGNREFDYTVYKYCNTDVVEVFGEDIVGYYFHYVHYGRAENRTATLETVTPKPTGIPSSGKVTIVPEGTQEFITSEGITVVMNFEDSRMTRQKFYDKEGVLEKTLEYYYFNDEENANVLRSLPNYECIVWNREYPDGTRKSKTEDGLRDTFEYVDILSKNEDGTITVQYKKMLKNVIDVEDYDEQGTLLYERKELYDETDNLLEVVKYEYYYKQDTLTGWTERVYNAENVLKTTTEYDAEGKEIPLDAMKEMTPMTVVAEGRKSFKISNGEKVTLVFDETGRIISQEHYDSDGIFKEQFDYYYFNDLDYVLRKLPNYDCIVWHSDYEDGSMKSKTEDSSKGGFSYVELLSKNGDGTVTVQYKKIPENIAITEIYNEKGILTYNRKELYDTRSNLKESFIYHYRENGTLSYHKKELYDGQGNLIEWISYDYREDETLSYNKKEVYNEQGNLKESVFYHCREDGTLSYGKKYFYDAQGNVNESVKYTYYYTENSLTGWTEQVYDTTSILRQTMYDAEGNVERWYSYEYDDNGKMSAIQYLGEGISTPICIQEYNIVTELFNEQLVDNDIHIRGYGSEISPVSQFVNANDGYGVAYHGDRVITIFLYTKEMKLYNKVEIESENALLGAITSDEKGNFYAVYGITNETDDVLKEVMRIVKYSSDGKKIGSISYTGNETGAGGISYDEGGFGTKYPFDFGNCSVLVTDNMLVCNYARVMYNGHQSNNVLYVDTTTMEKVDRSPCYTSHTFDQQVISTTDGGFLFADQGDAYGRAFVIHKLVEDNSGWNMKGIETFHFREGGNKSSYQKTFAQLGGICELPNSYVLVGASEKTLSLDLAPEDKLYAGYNEARNLFIQYLKKDFTKYLGKDCYAVEGEIREAEGTKPENATINLFLDENVVDYGVVWLTDYEDEYLVYNPKVATIKDNAIIILWQKVYYETEEIVDTYYAILDTEGNYIQEPVSLGSIPLSTDEPIVCLEDSIYWSVTEGKGLTTYRLIVSESLLSEMQ